MDQGQGAGVANDQSVDPVGEEQRLSPCVPLQAQSMLNLSCVNTTVDGEKQRLSPCVLLQDRPMLLSLSCVVYGLPLDFHCPHDVTVDGAAVVVTHSAICGLPSETCHPDLRCVMVGGAAVVAECYAIYV
jgi:hypothetical protein